jgi:hypothetical protein
MNELDRSNIDLRRQLEELKESGIVSKVNHQVINNDPFKRSTSFQE